MADDLSEREAALRRLPVPYSLALRLREAGVAREVICEYVGVEGSSLDGVYRIAEAKLVALQKRHGVSRGSDSQPVLGERAVVHGAQRHSGSGQAVVAERTKSKIG